MGLSRLILSGFYNATKPTLSDTQPGDVQLGLRGSLSVQLMAGDSTNKCDPSVIGDGGSGMIAAGLHLYDPSAANYPRARTPVVFKQLNAVVVGSETTIWTPGGGKKFRLMGFILAQGVATGTVVLKDNTAGTTIFTIPPHTLGVIFISPPFGNGILSAAANNVLTATGVATETLTGVVFGTEE